MGSHWPRASARGLSVAGRPLLGGSRLLQRQTVALRSVVAGGSGAKPIRSLLLSGVAPSSACGGAADRVNAKIVECVDEFAQDASARSRCV